MRYAIIYINLTTLLLANQANPTMSLCIFDLDNTLLNGDSDYLWGEFLVEQGIVDADVYERKNQEFYDQYKQGTLDIYEFLEFSLQPLSQHSTLQLQEWREQFMREKIEPIILDKGLELIAKHRSEGYTLMIITATNAFVTRPIADALGIELLLATEPAMIDNQYNGKVEGIPCFQDGKVIRLEQWLEANQQNLDDSWFYSDSHNDVPLLQQVSNAVAVDPDDALRDYAQTQQWPVISLRDDG